MKRWTFGFLVSAFFAGVAFVMTTVLAALLHIYRHGSSPLNAWSEAHSRQGAIAVGLAAGLITMAMWARATREE
jgi:hypothetical protein